MLRGHPALEGHLEPEIATLRRLLGVSDPIIRDAELASIVIFSAYYQSSDPPARTSNQAYFLDQAALGELRDVLVRYVDLLDGKSLRHADSVLTPSSKPSEDILTGLWRGYGSFAIGLWPLWLALLLLVLGGTVWRLGNFVVRGPLNFRLLTLVGASEEFLEFLDYSEGQEVSRGFSLRGLSLGAKRTLTSRALTLQSLIDHYLGYVRTIRQFYNGKLIVVIDELDKVTDPMQVRNILLELKGSLFEEGCFYLISISEDAARAFRGRLSEGRDIFESSFDDIITIRDMAPETAREMVYRRLATATRPPEIDEAAIDVLTMFSGAIPREIIRHLRELVLAERGQREITPEDSGLRILRTEVEEWSLQIREAPFSGDDLVRLHDNCTSILSLLDPRPPKIDGPWRSPICWPKIAPSSIPTTPERTTISPRCARRWSKWPMRSRISTMRSRNRTCAVAFDA
jgi:hypothetical protein